MVINLDVSMLEPCEPLERTLEAVQALALGDCLHVIHSREPRMLFPMLEGRFVWKVGTARLGRFEIYIWRADDAEMAATVQALMGNAEAC
ncbi:MAG: DUF2249 domain-containing protein [gamma proteobacterium endosymbiont of Lamellibrachia anaximandri]|nr:DUF2249 domain-containing protein [gamma proteobacterium endosymbiont of Lamellibrachia anaximandri]MBL3535683.1 DUF2249 domain-containing protein [gamma proteobacterium endosymbiont of Lamellibrachia anaximandri]MBL3600519.1 DUF2249 domain-containing protein [gamma proteobacterium endosymbiont of Lamellibrachia anaximandri]